MEGRWPEARQVLSHLLPPPQPPRSWPTHPQCPLFYPKQITSHFRSQSANEQPSWTGIKGVFTQPFLPPQRSHPTPTPNI